MVPLNSNKQYIASYGSTSSSPYKVPYNNDISLVRNKIISNTIKSPFEIDVANNLKLSYNQLIKTASNLFKKTKIYWNKLDENYNLTIKYNFIKNKATKYLTDKIDKKIDEVNTISSEYFSSNIQIPKTETIKKSIENIKDKLKTASNKFLTMSSNLVNSLVNFSESLRNDYYRYRYRDESINNRLNGRTKVVKDTRVISRNGTTSKFTTKNSLKTQEEILLKEDKGNLNQNDKIFDLFKEARLDEEPTDIVKAKLQEARSKLAKYHSCKQADKKLFEEAAVASFLEAFSLQTRKINEDLKLTDLYAKFDMAKTDSTKKPHNFSVKYDTSLMNNDLARDTIDYFGTLFKEDIKHIGEFNLQLTKPSIETYHEYQNGPFCQTTCVNNYLGVNFFHPAIATLLATKNEKLTSAPRISLSNVQLVHQKLSRLLIKAAEKWGFDKELLIPIINKLDIEAVTLKYDGKIADNYDQRFNDLMRDINKNNVGDLLLTFGHKSLQAGHIVSLKKSPVNKERWILLDGNNEPVELNFNGFIRYLKLYSTEIEIYYSKKNPNDNINEYLNRNIEEGYIPTSVSLSSKHTNNNNNKVIKIYKNIIDTGSIKEDYAKYNIYTSIMEYIENNTIAQIKQERHIGKIFGKFFQYWERLPQTFISAIKNFIISADSFHKVTKENITIANKNIEDICSYLKSKNIDIDINKQNELLKIREFLNKISNADKLIPKDLLSIIKEFSPAVINPKMSIHLSKYFADKYVNHKDFNWNNLKNKVSGEDFSGILDTFIFNKLSYVNNSLEIKNLRKDPGPDGIILIPNNYIDINKTKSLMVEGIKKIKTPINKIKNINKNVDADEKVQLLMDTIISHEDDYYFKKSISLFAIKAKEMLNLFNNKKFLDKVFEPNYSINMKKSQKDKAGLLLDSMKHCVLSQLITDLHYDELYFSLDFNVRDERRRLSGVDEIGVNDLRLFLSIMQDYNNSNDFKILPYDFILSTK